MAELLTAAQMRAIERAAINSGDVTGLELMERAGRGVVDAIFEEWPEFAQTSHRAVVLCGPGNNGGDGFVIARLLQQKGWEVEVFLYGDPDKLPSDAKVNYERWTKLGEVCELTNSNLIRSEETWFGGLIVDALFGIGLSRPLGRDLLDSWDAIFTYGFEPARKVSVDLPTGLCADSGRVLSSYSREYREDDYRVKRCFKADLTVTFEHRKIGHFLSEALECVGKPVVVPLRFERERRGPFLSHKRRALIDMYELPPNGRGIGRVVVGKTDQENETYRLPKDSEDHKYTHGHAVILSGPAGKTGAARLAARGALRIGAGLVTVATPHDALAENAAQLTAIMLAEAEDPDALTQILEDPRINALCIGPGFGVDRAGVFLRDLLTGRAAARVTPDRPTGGRETRPPRPGAPRSLVLDADALTALSQDAELFDALHEHCVLTPHAGEFKRLFPDIAEKLDAPATKGPAYSKVDATREAAKRAGCTVLYKGPDTVIASPDGRCSVNAAVGERAAPWLATAGSGDVLAGFITGLLARGFAPHPAAESAAYLHVECARSFGPGLIAEDLPEELPKVFRAHGL